MIRERIGRTAWALWGLLHIGAGLGPLSMIARGRPEQLLTIYGVPASGATPLHPVAVALLANHAFNLVWGGLFALIVAAFYNRDHNRIAYFANLAVISGFDIAFPFFMVLPGHVPLPIAALGPSLWLIGAIALAPAARKREVRHLSS